MKRKKLSAVLFDREMTQRQLARKAGLPESYISYYMRGKFVFDAVQKAKIAVVLDMKPDEIFEGQ